METPRSAEQSLSLLKPLVDTVATLGELVATVSGMDGTVQLDVTDKSLQAALGTFVCDLRSILCDHSVTLGDTSLSQALATLGATPGDTWAKVVTKASAWRNLVAELGDRWDKLAEEATELCHACKDAATAEATTKATERDLQDKVAKWRAAGKDLVATARQVPVTLDKEEVDKALAEHDTRVAAATNKLVAAIKAMEEAVVAASQARAATVRGQRAEVALGLLGPLVAACAKATALPQELQRRLGDIKATLEGTKEASPDVPQALVAAVAEAERLWEASARLAEGHLLGTLGDIRKLLFPRPGGPSGHSVAERCQKAIDDIPRLLRGQ